MNRNVHDFGVKQVWVIDKRIVIFAWTNPFNWDNINLPVGGFDYVHLGIRVMHNIIK